MIIKKIIKSIIGSFFYDLFYKYKLVHDLYKKNYFFLITIFLIIYKSQKLKKKLTKKIYNFKEYKKKFYFSEEDWFCHHAPIWNFFFKINKIINKKINYLEIGSFEGRSATFVGTILKKSNLTLVDPFINTGDKLDKINFKIIYNNFKNNISKLKNIISFKKTTSNKFFKNNKKKFDIIYIDGSHYAKDVLNDANNAFKILNKNGLIIFDDFLWKYYSKIESNPAFAILKFVEKKKTAMKILYVNDQVIIKKK